MSLRPGLAALAVVAVPVVVAAAPPPANAPAKAERRICRADVDLGSRVARVRRCRSRAEHLAMKQQARETVDRIQALKIVNNVDSNPGRALPSGGGLPR